MSDLATAVLALFMFNSNRPHFDISVASYYDGEYLASLVFPSLHGTRGKLKRRGSSRQSSQYDVQDERTYGRLRVIDGGSRWRYDQLDHGGVSRHTIAYNGRTEWSRREGKVQSRRASPQKDSLDQNESSWTSIPSPVLRELGEPVLILPALMLEWTEQIQSRDRANPVKRPSKSSQEKVQNLLCVCTADRELSIILTRRLLVLGGAHAFVDIKLESGVVLGVWNYRDDWGIVEHRIRSFVLERTDPSVFENGAE